MLAFARRHPVAVVFTAALLTRVVAAVAVEYYVEREGRLFLIEGDANGYWELSGAIAAGDPYVIGGRAALRMPGFPILLAAVRTVFGDSTLAARLAISAIGAGACAVVFLLGRDLVSDRVGWVAGLWTACSPTLVGFTPLILTESVFAACLTLSLWLLYRTHLRLRRNEAWLALAVLTGLSVAAATYVRPTWLLAAAAFAAGLMLRHRSRRGVLAAAVICSVTLISLLPWGVRNVSATGHFVLTTLWLGPSLYDGLHPGATGESDMTFIETDGRFVESGEFEANRYYRDAAVRFALNNPQRALDLAAIKLGRFWNPIPNAAQFQGTLPAIACALGFFPLMLLAARGAWTCRQPWLLLLCLAPILYFSVLHTLFVGSVRYRLPAEYPLSVLAAYGLFRNHAPKESA